MAVGSPRHEHAWSPGGALPEATPGARGAQASGPTAPLAGALDLTLVRATIQDGLLMVFGPDGDPVPPQVFGAAAAQQPDAHVRLADGAPARAERIAAVLAAQMSGRLAADGGGDAWIRAMLGGGPEPANAGSDDLSAEGCAVDVVAFGKELMFTTPGGATLLLAAARTPTTIGLRRAGEGPLAVAELVARLLAGAAPNRAGASPEEFAAPACAAWLEGDALRIALPVVGTVDLVRAGDDALAAAAPVSLFMASGELATLDDLLRALGNASAAAPPTGQADPLRPFSPGGAAKRPASVPLAIGLPPALAAATGGVALVLVHGLPRGACLSAGVASGDGSWLLSPRDLPGLALTLPPQAAPCPALQAVAIALADSAGELTSARATVAVAPAAAALPPGPGRTAAPDASPRFASPPAAWVEPAPAARAGPGSPPAAAAAPPSGSRPSAPGEPAPPPPDQPGPAAIALDLDLRAVREDGAFDAVLVRDLPAGMTLSAGTYDPAIAGWVLLPRQLRELRVIAAHGRRAPFTLCLLGLCLRPGGARPRVLARVPVPAG